MGKIDDIIKSSIKMQGVEKSSPMEDNAANGKENRLLHYCSICKTVVNVELAIYAIAAIIGVIPSYGLSIVAFGLLYILTIIPQYLIIEIGFSVNKVLESQKLTHDCGMAEQEMLKDKINSVLSKLGDKQEPQS